MLGAIDNLHKRQDIVNLESVEEFAEDADTFADTLADTVGVDVERKSENQVPEKEKSDKNWRKWIEGWNLHSKTHAALQIVRLAILDQQGDDQTRNEKRNGLEKLEVQGHLDVHHPAQNDQEGSDEEGDLQAAANRDTDRKVHLILVSNHDGRDMLRGVADNRDQH